MAVYTLSTSFLLIMICPLLKSPFAMIWSESVPIIASSINPDIMNLDVIKHAFDHILASNQQPTFADIYPILQSNNIPLNEFLLTGKGLNPLLQNFWMQIHPPILFAGFALTTVPFAFSIAALMKNEYKDWVKQSFPWMLAAAGVLGLGIMMGGYWAYGVLGWGGYWAWDPVENSSLVPWLISVAAIHTFLVQRKTQNKENSLGRFTRTNLILSILTYVTVIYSTFLTRSGILGNASVHSFIDQGRAVFIFLVLFILTFLGLGAGLIIYRWKSFVSDVPAEESLLSRELALFTAAVALCASAFIVCFGTSMAMVDVTVPAALYNEMHVPIAILIGLLNGISLAIRWKSSSFEDVWKKSMWSVGLSLIATAIAIFSGVHNVMMILLFLTSIFTLIVNTEIAIKIMRGNTHKIGAYVAHIGIALFLLGVIGSAGYSKEQNIDLIRGKKTDVLGYNMTFTGYHPLKNDPKKFAFNVKIDQGGSAKVVQPVMYQSEMNGGLMREPDILEGLLRDVYISPLGFDEAGVDVNNKGPKQEILSVTASIKPFVSLVWIGVIVMSLGFVVAMLRRLKESLIVSSFS